MRKISYLVHESLDGFTLAASLTTLGLIDESDRGAPVVLGGGTKLFPASGDRLTLRLLSSTVFDARAVLLRHERDGA